MILWKTGSLSFLLIRCRNHTMTTRKRLRLASTSSAAAADPSLLARAWTPPIAALTDRDDNSNKPTTTSSPSQLQRTIQAAIERTIPLLEDTASVPFVCRYRVDVIQPLNTQQVHHLQEMIQKHSSLESIRNKILQVIPQDDQLLTETVLTTISKAILDDIYAPYKPPAKGSILEQIQQEYPQLITAVDDAWSSKQKLGKYPEDLHEKVVYLLAAKIAAMPVVIEGVMEQLSRHCRVQTKPAKAKGKDDSSAVRSKDESLYNDFSCLLKSIRNHQVLAIERGVSEKTIQLSYEIDASTIESCMRYHLFRHHKALQRHFPSTTLLDESIHYAWTKTLRRKLTSRMWSDKLADARRRAVLVFQQNLRRALLAPPLQPPQALLALDPGFQAGIKCAVLDANGYVIRLDTVRYLANRESEALDKIKLLLDAVPTQQGRVLIALGNGHGSQEARALVGKLDSGKELRIELVNEAGASVWSVTPGAKAEFPDEQPAAVAAISIGRRLQNPLAELVKVPPRSLGLGMYQHDLSEKELDEKLHLTSVDAVATVGVDCNSCSLEILQKVPGLLKLAEKVMKKRPLKERKDLLKVPGLGPKTFENCAAFCRVDGPEPLDATLVHPESYELARFLLESLNWTLSKSPANIPPREQWMSCYANVLNKAADKFAVTVERALLVLENLLDSATQIDPRLRELQGSTGTLVEESLVGCSMLLPELAASDANLQKACPVRGIKGTVRNIVDFGVFVDFGGQNDGLLHTSKLGEVQLENLLIGQEIGVDILSVSKAGKVELALAGLGKESNTPYTALAGTKDVRKLPAKPKGKSEAQQQQRSISSSMNGTKRRKVLK